jgi:PH (Pleckstrin Homology) domain-containing protein
MRFESRRDPWLILIFRLTPFIVLFAVGGGWYAEHHDLRGPIAAVFILVIVELFFFESLLRGTYYLIDGGTLLIRSSFFTWRVPIADIRAVTPTRSGLSAPALSLDRLRIDYRSKSIMVSPEEKQRFIEALRAKNPSIVA